MQANACGGIQRFAIALLIAAGIVHVCGLSIVTHARAGGRDGQPAGVGRATPSVSDQLQISAAPLNPNFVQCLANPQIGARSNSDVDQALGEIPSPQDFSYTSGVQVAGLFDRGALPANYDLRTFGRVTSVKDQNPYGTCWAFASCGSLESGLLPSETWDFSEDNMVLASGFGYRRLPTTAAANDYVHRLLGPLGRPCQRERGRVQGRLHSAQPDPAQARAGGQLDSHPWLGARQ